MPQVIKRGPRRFLVRIFRGRHPSTGKRIYLNKTVESQTEAQRVIDEYVPQEFTDALKKGRSYIYAIQMIDGLHDYIKIGRSNSVAYRLKTLQCGSPYTLKLIASFLENSNILKQEEFEIHKRFSVYRVSGEWFRPLPDLIEWLQWRSTNG
jgi:hypothetical protein